MRKTILFIITLGLLFPIYGKDLPMDAKAFLEKGILQRTEVSSGWNVPSRAPLDFVDYALERTYGRRASKVWPLVGKEGKLVAYAIDLAPAELPKNVVMGMRPASAVIVSASLTRDAIIGELHGPRFSELFPCKAPQKIVLTQGTALAFRCGGRWIAGYGSGKEVTEDWVEENADIPPKEERAVSHLPESWRAFLSGDSSGRVYFTEFDECYPIDHNATFGVDNITLGDPHGDTHGCNPGLYWNYEGDWIQMIGLIAGYARLVWKVQKYGFKEAFLQDFSRPPTDEFGERINSTYHTGVFFSHWVNLGIYIYPEIDGQPPTIRKTLISEDYHAFGERNRHFWNTHRFFNTGAEVVLPFLQKYGRFVYENSIRPPFKREVGVSAARDAWFHYYKERLLKRAILIFDALDRNHQPYGIPDSIAPDITVAGWDDSKKLICAFTAAGTQWIGGPGGDMTIPPGYSWWAAERLANYPGFLYPPVSFSNTPPSLAFPTRGTVKEGETLTFVASLVWDREGEPVNWEIEESPFTVLEKGSRSFKILADRSEGNYVIWIKYSDGKNTVRHPIVVHVFPTFSFGE